MWHSIGFRLSVKINTVVVLCLLFLMVIPSLILAVIYTDRGVAGAQRDAKEMAEPVVELGKDPLARQAYGVLVYTAGSLLEKKDVPFVDVQDKQGTSIIPSPEDGWFDSGSMLVIEREVLGDHIGAGCVWRFRTGGGLRPVEDETACLFMPKGAGFGLAICKEILEHSGGTIRVESELGKGSNFVITMPCTEQQARLSLRQKARDSVPGLCF